MTVAQRGKQAHWPSAGGPAVSDPGSRRARAAGVGSPTAEREAALRWLENRDGGRSVVWFRRVMRAVWNRCSYLDAPIVYPWSPSRCGTGTTHDLHRVAASLTRKYHGRGLERLWLLIKAGLWPLLATATIGPLLWRCGRRASKLCGMSVASQARDLADAAWRHGIFPTEYYHHRIFRISSEIDRALYLHERELRALLRECARGGDAARVNDLTRFMAECRAAGLPALRTPVVAFQGRALFVTDGAGETLPQRDLFLRPATWVGSTSGQQWRWNAQAKTWKFRGDSRSAADLLEHAARLAHTQPWVFHEAISNHPDIARFSAGGVCTAHIATGLDEHRRPHVLFAALHLPASADGGWGPAPGELVAGIDVLTGRLGVALDEFVSDGEFATHPGTGLMIEDSIVPQWPALCDLALRAHLRFGDLSFVGWRIALSGGGPLLLEANTDWGVFRHVWPAQTRFAAWCLQRLTASAGNPTTVHADRDLASVSD